MNRGRRGKMLARNVSVWASKNTDILCFKSTAVLIKINRQ